MSAATRPSRPGRGGPGVRELARRAARGLGLALTLLPAAATFGAFKPAVPLIGPLGVTALGWSGPWIAILSLIAALRWIAHSVRLDSHRAPTLTAAALAAAGTIGAVAIVTAQWRTTAAHGIAVDPLRALYVGPVRHASGAPELATYTRFEGQSLPVQIIRPPRTTAALAPVLIYVHGGAWVGGVYWMRNHDLRWFADRGLVVVSIEYALSSPTRHLWNVTEDQIGCGLAWVRANVRRYGGDPARVALIGESAGGSLAIDVAYRAARGTLRPTCPGALPTVAAVVANYPAVDLAAIYRPEPGGGPATSYTGGNPAQFPERYAAITATTHLSRSSSPTLLIVGDADTLVDPAATRRLAARARALGVPTELVDVPFGGHVFDFMAGSIPNQLFRGATMRFLARYGVRPRLSE